MTAEYIEPNVTIPHGVPWEIGIKFELLGDANVTSFGGIWGGRAYFATVGFDIYFSDSIKSIYFKLLYADSRASLIKQYIATYTSDTAIITIKLGWNGTQYYCTVKEGDTIIFNETTDSSTPIYTDNQPVIGYSSDSNRNLHQTKIYLSDTYIKLNGEIAWRPYSS